MSESETKTLRPRVRFQPSADQPQEPITANDAAQEDEVFVPMIFPRSITLTNDLHQRVLFPAGLVNVPASLADHWYLVRQGVKRAEGVAPASAQIMQAPAA